jgi:hypothetical protein
VGYGEDVRMDADTFVNFGVVGVGNPQIKRVKIRNLIPVEFSIFVVPTDPIVHCSVS